MNTFVMGIAAYDLLIASVFAMRLLIERTGLLNMCNMQIYEATL